MSRNDRRKERGDALTSVIGLFLHKEEAHAFQSAAFSIKSSTKT